MRGKVFAMLLMVSAVITGCVAEEEFQECCHNGEVAVYLDLMTKDSVRSSISPDEDSIDEVNVYVYNQGILMDYLYSDDAGNVILNLNADVPYHVYVLANVGKVEPCGMENEFIQTYTYSISSVSDMYGNLPLAGKCADVVVSRTGQRVAVKLERLVSKITFSVDKDALEGLKITSVRMCQSALAVSPFREGGSSVSSENWISDGDYCSENDLMELNQGTPVYFYALENCQGVLLPDNADPWKKVPSSLDDRSGLCTYLEVQCRFDGTGLYEGEVVYRLYLGQDNCSDFNVIRNTVINVSLCLTGNGLRSEMSWRVEPDYIVRDGFAAGWISKGLHDEGNLYVGERFEYAIWLSEEMLEHLEYDMSQCEIVYMADGTDDGAIHFSDIRTDEDGNCFADAVCLKPSEGKICLRHKNGMHLGILSDNVFIDIPGISISYEPVNEWSDIVMDSRAKALSLINGDPVVRYVYLVDRNAANLNASSGYGFDLSVFDFFADLSADTGIERAFDLNYTLGKEADDGPALTLNLSCVNDGSRHDLNLNLIMACAGNPDISLNVSEENFKLEDSISVAIRSLPVSLTFVDNRWAGYGDSRIAVKVDNPSNLPIEVDCWQFQTTVPGDGGTPSEDVVAKVTNELIVNDMEYVTNQYNESFGPVYGSSHSFVSERNPFGDAAVEDGASLVYNLDDIDVDGIMAAKAYDGWGHGSLSHHISVMYADGSSVPELELNDCLSDGSSVYESIYGKDGLNDRGIWLYHDNQLVLAPESLFDACRGLTPDNIVAMRRQTPVVAMLEYDNDDNQLYVTAFELGEEGLVLSARCEAEADGYVVTHPDGTWGKPVENWCHERLVRYSEGFPVLHSGDKVSADNGTIFSLFAKIYGNKYMDSWNNIGSANSYMHRAHPVSLDMKMYFKLYDESDRGAYLFTPLYYIDITFYHVNEEIEYEVPADITYSTFSFVEVIKK